jgi:hypothetical protein
MATITTRTEGVVLHAAMEHGYEHQDAEIGLATLLGALVDEHRDPPYRAASAEISTRDRS